jgi:L-asparaginase
VNGSIVLLATGGTIAWHEKQGRMLSGRELADQAGVSFDEILDVSALPSWDLSVEHLELTAASVRTTIGRGASAVVVTHGTDTLEEGAWVTELLLGPDQRSRAGVVFTGAMRFSDSPDADGPGNLRQAAEVARAAAGHDLGVQVAFASRVHAARWVRKLDAWLLDPFDSGDRPPSAPHPPPAGNTLVHDVALVKVGPLSQPELPNSAGLVIEGTGLGHVPSRYHGAIEERLSAGRPVVIASRTAGARPPDPNPSGALSAGDLTAEKAALALMASMARHSGLAAIREWWADLLRAGTN